MPVLAPSIHSSKKQTADKQPSRTTVLHLSPDLEPGDPAREAVDLAILTQRAGWRALIASNGGLLVPEAERAAVRHTRVPLNGAGLFSGWRTRTRLAALVKNERPALLHAHGIEATAAALRIARLHDIPIVADFSSPLPERAQVRRALKQLENVASAVRVPSEFMARQVCDTFKWPASRTQVIPPGIDTQWCNPGSIAAERLQALGKLWRLPEQAAVVLMPMPFMQGGGHGPLLEALAKLGRDDVYAVLAGDNRPMPAARDEIESLVSEHGLDGKVIMPDYCLDWPAASWLATVIVAPNTAPRGLGHELLVAQAIGRPVIVSDCGANKEMVESGAGAWVVPPDDSAALAEALDEVLNLKISRRLDLAEQGSAFVADVFPQAGWFNAVMDLYDSLTVPAARQRQAEAA